ncbi:hypothetical protein BBO99_00001777 [Phytophthora kernoviae]|uniref:Cyclic nucleotide-binding domain-containing protein n=1 Tax=Phytophthora kernoviae TaxID=325452 RepID=A0A3R7KXK1_9STRA|nr:hypothetical protein BBI17_001548 [Phytophthora kernoviae]RLN83829.1 hypothetical protein BBO99_00001777 [Phytophthora kernoviae]
MEYARSLYYAVGVLGSPGKSVEPVSDVQLIAALLLMLSGFLITAIVVDNVQKRFTASAFEQKEFFAVSTQIQLFLRRQNAPLAIHHRVKSFLDYWWSSHRGAIIGELLADLPRPVRLDVLRSICLPVLQTLALLQGVRTVRDQLEEVMVENAKFILYGQVMFQACFPLEGQHENADALMVFLELSLVVDMYIRSRLGFYDKKTTFGENHWLPHEHLEHGPHILQYMASLYWSFGLMSASSEPEFPKTTAQCVFSVITMTTGFFLFAYVIGNFTDIIELTSSETREFNAKMGAVRQMLNHFQLPEALQERLKTFYLFKRFHTITQEHILVHCLPPSLLTDIRLVHLKRMIEKVEFLSGMEGSVTRMLVSQFTQVLISRGEYVCKLGEKSSDMFFVLTGVLDVLLPLGVGNNATGANDSSQKVSGKKITPKNGAPTKLWRLGIRGASSRASIQRTSACEHLRKVNEISAGSYFGENGLFTNGRRNAYIQAQTSCILYKLSRESLELVFDRYPEWKEKVMRIVNIHREQTRLIQMSRDEQRRGTDATTEFHFRPWLKLFRCLKIFNVVSYLDELNRRSVVYEVTRFWYICLLYLLMIYWATCSYLAVSQEVGFGTEWDAWLPSVELEISDPSNPSSAQLARRFLRGLFFATTTFVKKARNLAPDTASLYAFNITLSFVGLITMSFVIGELASLFISFIGLEVDFRKNHIAIELYLARLHISDRLKTRAHAFMTSFWSSHAGVNYEDILNEMPRPIRTACVLHVSKEPVDWFIRKIISPVCWESSDELEAFRHSLVERLHFEGYPSNEGVIVEGSITRAISEFPAHMSKMFEVLATGADCYTAFSPLLQIIMPTDPLNWSASFRLTSKTVLLNGDGDGSDSSRKYVHDQDDDEIESLE